MAILKAALADGIVPPAYVCSVCGVTAGKPLGRHSEDYRRPLDAYPVCTRCHYAIHIRFRRPDYWRRYIARLDPEGWFNRLSVDPHCVTRPFDDTYPRGLRKPVQALPSSLMKDHLPPKR
ncbi:MAG: hypothetical protein ACTHM0_10305 [Sphingomonas sp.]